MLNFLTAILAFLLAISILVAVHEFGHFWMARRFGVRVERFSIGFGRALYSWYDKLGTEYSLSLIPLGGYVSLFGENTKAIPLTERSMSFSHKPAWVRIAILLAGPCANLLFAVFVYWFILLLGVTTIAPILGEIPKDSVAGLAGLYKGQEIIAIEDYATPTWEAVSIQLIKHMGEDQALSIRVKENLRDEIQTKQLDLGHIADVSSESNWLESLGLLPLDPVPPLVGRVSAGTPAQRGGLQAGDLILSADGKAMDSRSEFIQYVQAHPNKMMVLQVFRHQKKLELTITPMSKKSDIGENIGFIGAEFPAPKELPARFVRVQKFGAVESLTKAFHKTVEYSKVTLEMLKKILLGQMSFRHISGPVIIAKYAGETASIGVKEFLDFLAKISISLGVFNLLPIPILDGGQCVYCVYELLTGRPVSLLAKTVGQWIGGIIILGVMMLAFYNDLLHLLR